MPDDGNTQAFVLIAFLVVTPVLCVAGYGKPGRGRIYAGLAVGFVMTSFCAVSVSCLCNDGPQLMQLLIPGACATAVMIFLRSPWIRFSVAALYFFASFCLCINFSDLVHRPKYCSNPALQESRREQMLIELKQGIRNRAEGDTTPYPAGWLHEAPLRLINAEIIHSQVSATPSPLWHSWLTGLYALHPAGLWYPGGRLSEAVDGIEYREWK